MFLHYHNKYIKRWLTIMYCNNRPGGLVRLLALLAVLEVLLVLPVHLAESVCMYVCIYIYIERERKR